MQGIVKDGKHLAFLATVDEEGKPHIRPLICIVSAGKIYFSTKDGSRKAKEIAMNPCVDIVLPDIENEKLAYICCSGEAFRIFDEPGGLIKNEDD